MTEAAPLDPAEVERLAVAALLEGRDADSRAIGAQAYAGFLAGAQPAFAARCAFWVGFSFMHIGERAQASGWFERARRVLDEHHLDCVERGYLLMPSAVELAGSGSFAAAERTFAEAARIGERFADRDLTNLARQGRGRALIALGSIVEGTALLDEVMVAVTAGEVSAAVAGTIYCSVIAACFDMWDVARATEWTDALNQWCAARDNPVAYRGECLIHRAEILRLHGVWPAALDEARRACDCLSQLRRPAAGSALYQLGEIHRVRGEFQHAEESYARAAEAGRSPYPGLALLRLAQGRADAARAAIARVLDEARDRRTRCAALDAAVDIMLATGDVAAASTAADELASQAESLPTPLLRAISSRAAGAVALARGDAKTALARLRAACAAWREVSVPYEAARTAKLLARACRMLGDEDGAAIELDSARRIFGELGAAADLAALDAETKTAASSNWPTTLSARELEVLRVLATGETNRRIADRLGISEKTVARHVSNIFAKLDVPSRAAATAYAFEHGLIAGSGRTGH